MIARLIEVALLALAAFGGWFGKPPMWIAQVGVALSVHLAMEYRYELNRSWRAASLQTTLSILWRIVVRSVLFVTVAFVIGRFVADNWPLV